MKPLISIQYLRAIAAIAVIIHHTGRSQTYVGQSGVDLFFVISGFIMMYTTTDFTSPYSFIMSRLKRIVPMYWIVTAFYFFVYNPELPRLLKSVLFVPTDGWLLIIQGWTLSCEIFYYVLFALSLLSGYRLVASSLLIVAFSTIGLTYNDHPWYQHFATPLLVEFIFGMVVCRIIQANLSKSLYVAIGCVILGNLVILSGIFTGYDQAPTTRVYHWGLPCAMILYGMVCLDKQGMIPMSNTLLLLGDSSYSIYLVHYYVIYQTGDYLARMYAPLATFLIVQITCWIGVATYMLVEKPIYSMLKSKGNFTSLFKKVLS